MNFHKSNHVLNKKQVSRKEYDRIKNKLENCSLELIKIQEQIQNLRSNKCKKINKAVSFLAATLQYRIKKQELSKLQKEIDNLVIAYDDKDADVITIGDKGLYKIVHSANNIEYKPFHLVKEFPDSLKDEVSIDSPIGSFILGKKVHDFGEVILPDNSIAIIEIISKE